VVKDLTIKKIIDMPFLNKAKHTIAEIGGVRCTIIENDATEDRVKFLTDLLVFNKYLVKVEENKTEGDAPKTYTIGVPDITFNPVLSIYERAIKTREGKHVTPAYWLQKTNRIDPRYWRFGYGSQSANQ
jgi:hypothetical protein